MNTWLWGPPTWKVLHTLSFAPAAAASPNPKIIGKFLGTLTHALPCVFCRVSYDGFTHELRDEQFGGRTVEGVAASGELAKWMYALHDKVNAKLDKQHAESLGLRGDDLLKRCRRRQITFDCLSKRFALQPIAFCADDVFDMLQIFATNMDATKSAQLPMQEVVHVPVARRRWNQLQFFMLLPQIVRIMVGEDAPLSTALSHLNEQSLQAALQPGSPPDAVLRHVTAIKLWYAHPGGFSPDQLEAQLSSDTTRLRRAFAKKCEHGSCS